MRLCDEDSGRSDGGAPRLSWKSDGKHTQDMEANLHEGVGLERLRTTHKELDVNQG